MPKRRCKAIIDDAKCRIQFEPSFNQEWWCCSDHRSVIVDLALSKVRKKNKRSHNAIQKREEKEERAKFKKRKDDIRKITWFHNKARAACNNYIRERDKGDICISCDKPLAFEGKYDAGHWKTQGGHKWIAYDEVNVNGQCTGCNCYKDGAEAAQRPRLVAKWGIDEIERLEQSGKNLGDKSYTRDELLDIEKHYKKKLKDIQ